MAIYRHFLHAMPEYLARYYWWAYLWRWGIWFFDHQLIINAILFGQYRRLMDETLARFRADEPGRTLQLTCVYGKLTGSLARVMPGGLHIMDVCTAQLTLARRKCGTTPLYPARMNAECLAYRNDAFDTVILFFLLHEMPPQAREHTLNELLRITRPGGRILITEYGPLPVHHWLYRFPLFRWILSRLEPFLPGFWREDLHGMLQQAAQQSGKYISRMGESTLIFSGFYRVVSYRVDAGTHGTAI